MRTENDLLAMKKARASVSSVKVGLQQEYAAWESRSKLENSLASLKQKSVRKHQRTVRARELQAQFANEKP